jgi:hypothetical protein
MTRLFLLLLVSAALTACAFIGKPYDGKPRKMEFDSPLCGEVKGYTVGYIVYGDSKMVMIPLSKVAAETVFVVGLKPLDGFEDAEVTVTGTSAKAIPWLTGVTEKYEDLPKGRYPKGAFEVGCVPNDPVGTQYKFAVKIEKGDVTNLLDPRARVVD